MVAVVEVDAGQEAKRMKATDEEEGQQAPPPQTVVAARKHRQLTPDHPPYCWMIGEAIDALAEDGGSEEDSISAFIRARHPGVPAAHDRLLRHYLGKHVAEGFFVRTAAGRYERSSEENEAVELPLEQPECVGSPVVEAKRGRGRPRKDGSSSTPSPAGNKDGSAWAQLTTPKCCKPRDGSQAASSTPKRVTLAAAKDTDPMSPVAVADKAEIQTPKHHGQRDGSQAASSTPKRATLVAAKDSTDPMSPATVAYKKAEIQTPKRRGRLRKQGMATTTDSSGKALVACKKDGSEPPCELALVIAGGSSATASAMSKACTKEPPTPPPVDGGQPLDLALVTTTEVPVPAPVPTPAMNKKDGGDAQLVAKNDSIFTTPTASEPSSRSCKLALMAAADGFVPMLVADKDGLKEAPSASYKHARHPCKAGTAPTAGKKFGGKALSAAPKGHRRRCNSEAPVTGESSALTLAKKVVRKVSFASPKLTTLIAGACSTPASVADQSGIKASGTLKRNRMPRKQYPVTAEEMADDPDIVLLALPSQPPARVEHVA